MALDAHSTSARGSLSSHAPLLRLLLFLVVCTPAVRLTNGLGTPDSSAFRVKEGLPTGTRVGRLKGVGQAFLDKKWLDYFRVDDNMYLITKAVLNRENRSLCKSQAEVCRLSVIYSSDGDFYSQTVFLLDVNDHAPLFKVDIKLTISENSVPKMETFSCVAAIDSDLGKNSEITYSLSKEAREYLELLDTKPGDDMLKFHLIKPLDYETWVHDGDFFSKFSITATNTVDGLHTSAPIQLTVINTNDNRPVFAQEKYTVKLKKTAQKDDVIFTAVAVDHDISTTLEYSFTTETISNLGHLFAMETTGDVLLEKGLHAYTGEYTLKIRVTDNNHGTVYFANTELLVKVPNVNIKAPSISFFLASKNGIDGEFYENQKTKHLMKSAGSNHSFAITVKDEDSGDDFTCSVKPSHSFRLVKKNNKIADKTFYNVLVLKPFDREKVSSGTLVIVCKDALHLSSKTIKYRILDRNDNRPVFNKARYTLTVVENNKVGLHFAKNKLLMNVTDKDKGINSRIKYSIDCPQMDGMKIMEIDPNTAELTLKKSFDREVRSNYTCTIRATDSASPTSDRMWSTAVLDLLISDTNDSPPKFQFPQGEMAFKFALLENQEIKARVGIIKTTDPDVNKNSVVYEIVPSDDAKFFRIDKRTGILHSTISFDREKRQTYKLRVSAYDPKCRPVREKVYADVTVDIADQNDNRPFFLFQSTSMSDPKSPDVITISHEMPQGYSFYRLLTDDKDVGSNADVTYKLLNPTSDTTTSSTPTGTPTTPTTSHTPRSIPGVNSAGDQAEENDGDEDDSVMRAVPFDLQTFTGILTLAGSLDRDRYSLHVQISDNPTSKRQKSLTSRHVLRVLVNRTLPFDMSLLYADDLDGDVTGALLTYRARVLVILITCSMAAIAMLLIAIVILKRRSSASRGRRSSDKRLYITNIPVDVASGTYTGYQRDDSPPSPNACYYGDSSYMSAAPALGGGGAGGCPSPDIACLGDAGVGGVGVPGKLENIARKSVNRLSDNSERDHFTLNDVHKLNAYERQERPHSQDLDLPDYESATQANQQIGVHQFLQLMSPQHSATSGGGSSVCSADHNLNHQHNSNCTEQHSSSSDSGRCTDLEPAPLPLQQTSVPVSAQHPQHRRVMFDAANNSFRTLTPATTPATTTPGQAIHYKNNSRESRSSAVDV